MTESIEFLRLKIRKQKRELKQLSSFLKKVTRRAKSRAELIFMNRVVHEMLNIEISEKMSIDLLKEIKLIKKYWQRKINNSWIVDYEDGFIATGFLKEPVDHITKGANTISLLIVNINDDKTDTIVNQFFLTLSEAKSIIGCLHTIIKMSGE